MLTKIHPLALFLFFPFLMFAQTALTFGYYTVPIEISGWKNAVLSENYTSWGGNTAYENKTFLYLENANHLGNSNGLQLQLHMDDILDLSAVPMTTPLLLSASYSQSGINIHSSTLSNHGKTSSVSAHLGLAPELFTFGKLKLSVPLQIGYTYVSHALGNLYLYGGTSKSYMLQDAPYEYKIFNAGDAMSAIVHGLSYQAALEVSMELGRVRWFVNAGYIQAFLSTPEIWIKGDKVALGKTLVAGSISNDENSIVYNDNLIVNPFANGRVNFGGLYVSFGLGFTYGKTKNRIELLTPDHTLRTKSAKQESYEEFIQDEEEVDNFK